MSHPSAVGAPEPLTEPRPADEPGEPRACPVCGSPTSPDRGGLYDDRYGYPGTFVELACATCGHRFLDASFTGEELRHLYTDYYPRSTLNIEKFQPHRELHGFGPWLEGERASAFRWVPKNVRVLDVGCGFGQTLAYHAARGCDAHGIDADENLLRVAERYGLNARSGLFRAADYEPDSFDYVTLDQVIEHGLDPAELLRDVATVLRPGGTAIIATPNAAGYGARVFGDRWINWHVPYHLQHFSPRSLETLAERCGLEVASIRTLTNSRWLRYQYLELGAYPPPGVPAPFWDPKRSPLKVPRRRRRNDRWLHRARVYHAITRVADAAGRGDNLLCVLRKPG